MKPASRKSRLVWIVPAVALVSAALYLPTVRYGFVWDDHYLVGQNHFLARTNPLELLRKGFWYNPGQHESLMRSSYYRPLVNISFFLERKLWGAQPAGYHLTNVLLHAANSALVVLVASELLAAPVLAGAVGLLFAVHPALNSVPTFISNRTYLLAALFALLSFLFLVNGQRRPGWWPKLLYGLFFLLALLAQEAVFAYTAIALGWLLLRRRSYLRLWSWLLVTAAVWAIYFTLRLGLAGIPLPAEGLNTVLAHPFAGINSFGQQLGLLIVPFFQKVTYAESRLLNQFSAYTVLGLVFLAGLVLAAVRVRVDAARLGAAWAGLFLLPFAHLMPLGPSGRMLYLPAVGVLLLAAALVRRAGQRNSARTVAVAAFALVVAAFGFETLRRNPVWKDEETLNRVKVSEAPDSPLAHDNQGVRLREAGDIAGAIRAHRRAIELKPDLAPAHNNLGSALFEAGNLAEAIAEYRAALEIEPGFAMAHNNLGVALQQSNDLTGAEAEYRAALRFQPELALARNNLGEIQFARSETDSAEDNFLRALASNPNYPLAHFNFGLVRVRQGRLTEAEGSFRRALELAPDFVPAREQLQRLLERR